MATAISSRFARDATLTNGRYELPRHARGVLVLADPPEAGWRIEQANQEGDPCGQPPTIAAVGPASSRPASGPRPRGQRNE
jgi:hypothetical protein